jgi:endonuclease YncB( thermonuclease family)
VAYLLVLILLACPRGTLTGEVTYVRDGDTVEVGGLPIRLSGLAAPEWDEPGGAAARKAMVELVDGHTLPRGRRHRRDDGCDRAGERLSAVLGWAVS